LKKPREEANYMTDEPARQITEIKLARLGAKNIAYVHPIHIDNKMQFMLMARDRRELGVAPNYQIAIFAALENDLEPVRVH
jgi:hypothetical protein